MIRKKRGEADGWAVAVCLKSVTGFDDEGAPFQVVSGEEYYIQGEADPNIFEVVQEKASKKPKPPVVGEEKPEEV